MLTIDVNKIPEEGMTVKESLLPAELHVAGEEGFSLLPGGCLEALIERGEDETVHVRGQLAAALGLECGRCLEPFSFPVKQDLDLFYLPHLAGAGVEEEDEVELSDRDMVVAYYSADRLDLGEMLREQLFLAIPMKRVCGEACLGLCPCCGRNRNITPCSCTPEESDPRLLPLKDLLGKGSKPGTD